MINPCHPVPVKGIVVPPEWHPELQLAARLVPQVDRRQTDQACPALNLAEVHRIADLHMKLVLATQGGPHRALHLHQAGEAFLAALTLEVVACPWYWAAPYPTAAAPPPEALQLLMADQLV